MIVITGAMMASAAIAGGGSALGAFGDYQKNRAALKRSNRQAEKLEFQDAMGFMRNMQSYKAFTDAELAAYEADVKNLTETYELNGRARQRSIESGLTQLADISDGFIQKAFSRSKRLAESTGKAAASGMTGVTAGRFDRVQKGQALMNTATDVESMDRAVGAFIFRDKGAALQQEYANKNAFNRVRPPTFGPAPAAPQGRTRQQDYTGRDFAFGLAGALGKGLSAGLAKAPDMPFQDPPPLPQMDWDQGFGTNSALANPAFSLGGSNALGPQGWYGVQPSAGMGGFALSDSLSAFGINRF